ncbi:hypothetical protein BH10PLA2_BH10PLA2_18330 [soil metagenome]
MTFLWAILFVLLVLGFWCSNLIGMPGKWLIVVTTVVYACLIPDTGNSTMRWCVVAAVAGLAILGEVLELGASAASVKKVGGSRRGSILALIGSLVGAVTGVFVGIPIPIVGSIVAALLFAGMGATAGAMLGEFTKGRSIDDSWKVGQAAFWGRLFGTLAKTMVGAVMVGVAIVVVFL